MSDASHVENLNIKITCLRFTIQIGSAPLAALSPIQVPHILLLRNIDIDVEGNSPKNCCQNVKIYLTSLGAALFEKNNMEILVGILKCTR